MPVILYTDAFVFLLVIAISGFIWHARRQEHMRRPWRQVVRSRMAMVSMVVLGVYAVIGLLDSLHFHPRLAANGSAGETRYSNEILSVFDVLVTPLREHTEKTFSEPFATRLYAMEAVELPDGGQVRAFPRLLYGGAHLPEPDRGRLWDITWRSGLSLLQTLVVWTVLAVVIVAWLARRRGVTFAIQLRSIRRRETAIPWHAFLLALAVVLAMVILSMQLGTRYHILGTDKVGEDVFYQALKSIRTGLLIGTLTTLIMLPFAIMLGVMAGYFRGWIDDVIQYLYTTLNSIPSVLLIAAAILMLHVYMNNHAEAFNSLEERADLRLLFLCLILGVTSWTGLCRLLRGESLKLREVDYVQAATALGVRPAAILTRHLVPNVMHIVLITVVLDFSGLVLAEAVLSYVNIGVDPSTHSWGNMINSARLEMAREPIVWWSLAAAFVFMFTLVLAANLFSDVVRDAFDPRA